MAMKPQFSVEVDDAAFKNFQAAFQKYQQQVAESSGVWDKNNKKITDFADKFKKVAVDSAKPFNDLAKITGKIADNVARATGFFARWAGIASFMSGALGMFSIMGLNSLANYVQHEQTGARGLGISIGKKNAFGLAYERYFDPDSALGKMADIKSDPSKWSTFAALGINDFQNKDAADLTEEAARKARALYKQYNGNKLALDAMHATDLFSMDQLRTMATAPDSEMDDASKFYHSKQKDLGINDRDATDWANFHRTMGEIETSLKHVFITVLTPLAPELEKLTQAFGDAIKIFLKSDTFADVIDDLADGLGAVAKELGSDEFQLALRHAIREVGVFYNTMKEFISWLGKKFSWLMPSHESKNTYLNQAMYYGETREQAIKEWDEHVKEMKDAAAAKGEVWKSEEEIAADEVTLDQQEKKDDEDWLERQRARHEARRRAREAQDAGAGGGSGAAGPASPANDNAFPDIDAVTTKWLRRGGWRKDTGQFADLQAKYPNLPSHMLWQLYGNESSYGTDLSTSGAGAKGAFQFMDATARQYGVDVTDEKSSADGAARYMSYLLHYFGGDHDKAIAAYNAGEGRIGRAVDAARAHGNADDWLRYAPQETRDYVGKYHAQQFIEQNGTGAVVVPGRNTNPPQVNIRISNQSGNDVNVNTQATGAS